MQQIKSLAAILEWLSEWKLRTARYVALLSRVTLIENRRIRRAMVTSIERHIPRAPWTTAIPAPETYHEEGWGWKSLTSSWTEGSPQCSRSTPSQTQPLHPPCSKQSLSKAQTACLPQTATTISTSICFDLLALPMGTYKAVLVDQFLI